MQELRGKGTCLRKTRGDKQHITTHKQAAIWKPISYQNGHAQVPASCDPENPMHDHFVQKHPSQTQGKSILEGPCLDSYGCGNLGPHITQDLNPGSLFHTSKMVMLKVFRDYLGSWGSYQGQCSCVAIPWCVRCSLSASSSLTYHC